MNKGYIVPTTLIVLLLIFAGFFVFTPVQSPIIPQNESVKSTTTPSFTDTDEFIEKTATTTNPIENTSTECLKNEDCGPDGMCYFEPGGTIGVCTNI
ncbi:MAG: hypothetical protein RLZZ517_669 [Candidatus Parcubacteria bacterium]|jgi:hypothetical protein